MKEFFAYVGIIGAVSFATVIALTPAILLAQILWVL